MAGQKAHLFHGEQVFVNAAVRVREDGGKLMLRRCYFIMLRFCGNAQRPQLVVELLHEFVYRGANGAKVMLFKLLALAGGVTEQRAAGQNQVGALLVLLFGNQEVLLLGANGGYHALLRFAEACQRAICLLIDGFHGAQQRRFLVKRFARVAAKRRGDAQNFVLDESVRRGVPSRVTACLKRGAQAARGEA